jgi:hypothetical protein
LCHEATRDDEAELRHAKKCPISTSKETYIAPQKSPSITLNNVKKSTTDTLAALRLGEGEGEEQGFHVCYAVPILASSDDHSND